MHAALMGHVDVVSRYLLSDSGKKKVRQIYASVCNSGCSIAPFLEDDDLQPVLLQMPGILDSMPHELQKGLNVLGSVPSIFGPSAQQFKSLVMQARSGGK